MIENSATVDQKKPNGKGREIAPLVIEDLLSRVKKGVETYGEPLKSDNGRDPLVDLYQELLDGAMYIRQELEQRKKYKTMPKTIFSQENDRNAQFSKIASECKEFLKEYDCFCSCTTNEDADEFTKNMFDEATDIKQAYDTLYEIDPEEVEKSIERVIEKNDSRGYYVR